MRIKYLIFQEKSLVLSGFSTAPTSAVDIQLPFYFFKFSTKLIWDTCRGNQATYVTPETRHTNTRVFSQIDGYEPVRFYCLLCTKLETTRLKRRQRTLQVRMKALNVLEKTELEVITDVSAVANKDSASFLDTTFTLVFLTFWLR